MKYLVCLLEEPSAREMLKGVLPRIIPEGIKVHYFIFEGKQDLEKQLERKIRLWKQPNSMFFVMRDQDQGDCKQIKENLSQKVIRTNRQTETLIRIACRELESFYLGDLLAVEEGLSLSGLSKNQQKEKYRVPDALPNPSEILSMITERKYQKVSGSRMIAPYLKIDGSNRSRSFNVLLDGIKNLAEEKS